MKLDRVIFSFRHKCNMRCPFCYIPFIDDSPGTIVLWKKVIDRIMLFEPKQIVFGGGDPFMYHDFVALLEFAAKKQVKLHVDTNGLALKDDSYNILQNAISSIAFPLEGPREYHDIIRMCHNHFEIVTRHIKQCNAYGIPVHINTVITEKNIHSLVQLANILREFKIALWNIYEYWAFDNINFSSTKIDVSLVEKKIQDIKAIFGPNVIYSPVQRRKSSYLFVSSIGNVYTISPDDPHKYYEIGYYDDPAIMNMIEAVVDPVQNNIRYSDKQSGASNLNIC